MRAWPRSHPPPGLFTLALVAAAEEAHLLCAALFACLLCMKHIFLYAAPAFFVYLLRRYCRGPAALPRFLGLGAVVASIFGAAFGPFVAAGQLPQVGCAAPAVGPRQRLGAGAGLHARGAGSAVATAACAVSRSGPAPHSLRSCCAACSPLHAGCATPTGRPTCGPCTRRQIKC